MPGLRDSPLRGVRVSGGNDGARRFPASAALERSSIAPVPVGGPVNLYCGPCPGPGTRVWSGPTRSSDGREPPLVQIPAANHPVQRQAAFAWVPGGVFTVAVLLVVALFVVAPGSFATKAHLALHGLCAQTPTHTFAIGGQPLPFDARMTGIYGGFAAAFAWLVWRQRLASAALPSWPVGMALLGCVGAMGIDGTNSLLLDLGLPHPYAPHNLLRLGTGMLAGVALAAVLVYLVAGTLWRAPRDHEAAIGGLRELAVLVGLGLLVCVSIPFAPGWLYGSVAALLLASAVTVVSTVALVGLVLARRQDGHFRTFADLQRPGVAALGLGVLVMATISGARLLAETSAGLPLPIH